MIVIIRDRGRAHKCRHRHRSAKTAARCAKEEAAGGGIGGPRTVTVYGDDGRAIFGFRTVTKVGRRAIWSAAAEVDVSADDTIDPEEWR